MDDIILLTKNQENLQLMLDATNDFLREWNLKLKKKEIVQ